MMTGNEKRFDIIVSSFGSFHNHIFRPPKISKSVAAILVGCVCVCVCVCLCVCVCVW